MKIVIKSQPSSGFRPSLYRAHTIRFIKIFLVGFSVRLVCSASTGRRHFVFITTCRQTPTPVRYSYYGRMTEFIALRGVHGFRPQFPPELCSFDRRVGETRRRFNNSKSAGPVSTNAYALETKTKYNGTAMPPKRTRKNTNVFDTIYVAIRNRTGEHNEN